MDYGKYKYESAQKARASRRNQQQTVIKEMKLRPKIDKHDYETKKGHIVRFLTAGDKVKVTIMFRGREQSRPELGRRLLDKLAEELSDLAIIESAAKQDGRNMIMVLASRASRPAAAGRGRKRRRRRRAGRSGPGSGRGPGGLEQPPRSSCEAPAERLQRRPPRSAESSPRPTPSTRRTGRTRAP